MKVTELIHNAIDDIILSQLFEYVTVINVTNMCLLSYHYVLYGQNVIVHI